MRTNILKAATSLAFGLIATSAFAHAQLEKATPPVGGTVATPSEIRLTFSEGVEPRFCKVSLTGPGGLRCRSVRRRQSPATRRC